MYLFFSAFTSRPIALLATTKASVFLLHSTYACAPAIYNVRVGYQVVSMGILASSLDNESVYSLSTANSASRSTITATIRSGIKKKLLYWQPHVHKYVPTVSYLHVLSHLYKTGDTVLKYGIEQSKSL